MSYSIFLLSTASQAFFLKYTPQLIQKSILIITVKNRFDANKVLHNVQHLSWRKIYIWYIPEGKNRYENFKLFKIRLKIIMLRRKYPDVDKVYMGSYPNLIHLSVVGEYEKKSKIFLLYDGLMVLAKNEERKKDLGESVRQFPKFYNRLGFKRPQIKQLSFISPLPLKVRNEDSVQVIENFANRDGKHSMEKSLFFIGQPLTKNGIISADFYLESLLKLKKKFYDYDIYYFSHPREEKELLNTIKTNLEVKELDIVFEEYYMNLEVLPTIIVSFYSAVLVNLMYFQTPARVISLEIPNEELSRFEDNILPIYQYFHEISNKNFSVVNLADW